MKSSRWLVWDEKGWIAVKVKDHLIRLARNVETTAVRMENQAGVHDVLDSFKPTHVFNCAGKTGRPNVDWCETNRIETIESNHLGVAILAKACNDRSIHLTTMATGCKSSFANSTYYHVD